MKILTALVVRVFGQHIDGHLRLLSGQYNCRKHRSGTHTPYLSFLLTPPVLPPKR